MLRALSVMKFIIATISILIFTLIAAFWLIGAAEFHENEFSTYEELSNSELINKGWVPRFVPESAYTIKESHYVDQSFINVEFSFAPEDLAHIEKACYKIKTYSYICAHADGTVLVEISNGNHAKIISVPSNT